jgi:hypothetical protein
MSLRSGAPALARRVPDPADNGIIVDGVRKSFGTVDALRGVDLTVPRGSIIALLGPNGAVVDATRALLIGGAVAHPLIWACVWSAGLFAIFTPLSGHRYRQLG